VAVTQAYLTLSEVLGHLDMLLAAPRSVESVLASRMVVQVIRLFVLSLLFTSPALVLLAIVNQNPLIPLAFAMLFFLYPIFVVVIISLMSLLLVRIIPVGRGREVLTLFGIALAIGINLATAGWLSGVAIAYFVACELLRIRWEERILAQTFPDEYPEYARRVPRYIPNPFARR